MNSQQTPSDPNEINPRTARAVAAILSQTATDESLHALNQSDGRNQSEQASFLHKQSPFVREIYERGGTMIDGVLTVPKDNLTLSPEIELTTPHAAVERLTRITRSTDLARELAPQLIEMGNQIAGSHADGETRLRVFNWLYQTLENKQELLSTESKELPDPDIDRPPVAQFNEKWEQIVELSKVLAALEPKDSLPEQSFDELIADRLEHEAEIFPDEDLAEVENYENQIETTQNHSSEDLTPGGNLIGFERIEIGSDLPKIPENLFHSDFEKLLGKTVEIDRQLENGVPKREVLAPFRTYVEATKLDNELRLVEESYYQIQNKKIGTEKDKEDKKHFVPKREEIRELNEDTQVLEDLRQQQTKIKNSIETGFDEGTHEKVKNLIAAPTISPGETNQKGKAATPKVELTEDEASLRELLIKEKSITREIENLTESILARKTGFRSITELSSQQIPTDRKQELIEKVRSIQFPSSSLSSGLTNDEKNNDLNKSNTFEISNPAEYLFVREAAHKHFEILRDREIKNEYSNFAGKNVTDLGDAKLAKAELKDHREKINTIESIKPDFLYKLDGSSRIIDGKPSERAVAGHDFINQYINYQLKQPETRLRRESNTYRTFTKRLESAKSSQDVIQAGYEIRQENHRQVGAWKNTSTVERGKLECPLSRKELAQLFLEQPPKSYTAEMTILKYNFAHYTQAKEKMTTALLEGKLNPSAEAQMINESLNRRLSRRDLGTKHKATKHFFESLKTENEKLVIKNEFDHAAIYKKLPPHEKDWIYTRATQQKENLEYKIAYTRQKSLNQDADSASHPSLTNQSTKRLAEEFAAGTSWHQALILTEQNENKPISKIADVNEKTLRVIGFLIHNQTEVNNLRVGDWLGAQRSDELKTAGEILKTFAGATREIENNKLTVIVKLSEMDKIPVEAYKELFERYFPANFEKLKEFQLNENFKLERSRRQGQTMTLDDWKKDFQSAIYKQDAPVRVFENESLVIAEIEKIKQIQTTCRRAAEIQTAILRTTEEKLKNEFAKNKQEVSPQDLQVAVRNAFVTENSENLSANQKTIFEKAQNHILNSDYERFTENNRWVEHGIKEIHQSFETISALRSENAQFRLKPSTPEKSESLQEKYETLQEQSQSEITTATARERFLQSADNTPIKSVPIKQFLSTDEQEKVWIESYSEARIALQPNELNEPGHSPEVIAKALEFADALEDAHQLEFHGGSKEDIAAGFSSAEEKQHSLNEFLNYKKETNLKPIHQPITLKIYERELARNERAITQSKISEMIETGEISLADFETKKIDEIFSPALRAEIKLEAGERTHENLEPKELWTKRQSTSEKLQEAALKTSETLEQAHQIYHDPNASPKDISAAFAALDGEISNLKGERRKEQNTVKYLNFKNEVKRDLAQLFESNPVPENKQFLTVVTKGLLISALDKQNIQTDKIGINSEKLGEISRTIVLAMNENKMHEKEFVADNHITVSVHRDRQTQLNIDMQSHQIPIKSRKIEHTR